jgi:NAD(P) transhydrogenase subunit alpha
MDALARTGVTAFAMELIPRISRAQSMDALSSQAGVAGYRAVILAASEYRRFMPMLMTAAGTVKAARVLVIGAGVAGLQAIATARRLGAIVEAFDVRPAVKQEVESLGARFVDVPMTDSERAAAQTVQGYAREMSDAYRQRQDALIQDRSAAADIVITAAFVPGRPAPLLIREATVARMKPGSVIVDLAVEQGGNCEVTKPDQVVLRHGVRIVGYTNVPSQVAADASALYARNLVNFVKLLVDPGSGAIKIDTGDEIVAATLVCTDGARAHAPTPTLA